jgi:hypothetical protein
MKGFMCQEMSAVMPWLARSELVTCDVNIDMFNEKPQLENIIHWWDKNKRRILRFSWWWQQQW